MGSRVARSTTHEQVVVKACDAEQAEEHAIDAALAGFPAYRATTKVEALWQIGPDAYQAIVRVRRQWAV